MDSDQPAADSQQSRMLPNGAASQHHRHTKTPPPVRRSSMTPPPTSQPPSLSHSQSMNGHSNHSKDAMRTPTPTHSHLSSPPPTVKGSIATATAAVEAHAYAQDTVESLRDQLRQSHDAVQAAKSSAANANLQFHLLWVEHQEFKRRSDVEQDMTRKEVQVLRERELNQAASNSTIVTPMTPNARPTFPSPSDQEVMALRNRVAALQIENDKLRDQVDELKDYYPKLLRDKDREIRMLRDRIRENYNHRSAMIAAGAMPYLTPSTQFGTPRTARGTAQPTPRSQPASSTKPRGHDAFDQLLLAHDVLSSQDAQTTPSTPTGRRGHQRGVQSLSSLPNTPMQARSVPQPRPFENPYTPRFARTPQVPQTAPVQRQRRRESRDSTISADDGYHDDSAVFNDHSRMSSPDPDVVEGSIASQEAANILRKSFASQSSQSRSEAPKSSGLLQSKLGSYGKISKAVGSEKRKPSGSPIASQASPTKKRGEGVGLGIGGWEPRRA